MGEMAEYYEDMAIAQEMAWEYHDKHYNNIHYKSFLKFYMKGELFWCKKDGNHVLIQNMEDSHLLNSIRWIEKNHLGRTCMVELKDILLIEKHKRSL
jgi:hypothetical protein